MNKANDDEKTHDYTKRYWGHDFQHFGPRPDGKLPIMGLGRGIRVGDYIILPNEDETTTYRFMEIKYENNPPDMWKGLAEFTPRGK